MPAIRPYFVSLAIALLLPAAAGAQHRIETYAGGGPDDMAAIAAAIGVPRAVAVDTNGNMFIASEHHRVFKIDAAGHLTSFAGTGVGGFGGDGGPARDAMLSIPTGVAVDGQGNVYICDWNNARIRRVDAVTLEITTVAGGGPVDADGVLATTVALGGPNGVAVDAAGQIYIAETGSRRIRRVDAAGMITTVVTEPLDFPMGVAVDGAGNIFVADTGPSGRVQKIDSAGVVSTAAVANFPSGVALAGGILYITEQNGARVLQVAAGTTTVFAGTGVNGFSGDGAPAIAARLSHGLFGVATDASGNVFIADSYNRRVRRVDASGTINTVAGSGQLTSSGDGGPALNASLTVTGLAVDGASNVYFPDAGRIRRIAAATGVIDTLAGSEGIAVEGFGIAPDGVGGWLVADFAGHRVRRIDASGAITTVAGTGVPGLGGDGGSAISARLNGPMAVAVDAAGNIFIADTFNHRVRKVDGAGTITTVAGNGTTGLGGGSPLGDGGPATSARVWNPTGLAFRSGEMYIAEQFGHRVRKVDTSGVITTFAGGGSGGDGGPASNALLGRPTTLAFDALGNLYITETELTTSRVRRVDASGTIETIAGSGVSGFSGDGGPATSATFAQLSPWGVAVDSLGNVLLGDRFNNRIRRVTNAGPVADAGADRIAAPGLPFTLSGHGSSDPDGDALSYVWLDEFGSVAATSREVTLTRAAGTYTFTLTVRDGFISDTDTVVVSMNPAVLVNIFGGGAGIVTSSDGGISCASGTAVDCAESYAPGTLVTLTATPEQWSVFGGWDGACAAFNTNVCSITVTANALVRATFDVETFTLTTTNAGGGTVTSSVGGINCGAACSGVFIATTPVTLTATAAPGYRFDGWSGACSGTGLCGLTMTADLSVTATFSSIALTQLVVSPATATLGVGQMQPFTATGSFTAGPPRVVSPVSALEAGDGYTCALLVNGTVQCWGGFAGLSPPSPVPVTIPGLSEVVSLGAGTSQACAVLADGSVKCWGIGFLGDGVTTSSTTPVTVSGISTATAVVVGASNTHACVLLGDGSVRCWGAGGLLGDGTFDASPTPVPVSGITTAVAITAEGGTHTCALLADRTLRCWGGDPLGQLGDGGPLPGEQSAVPVMVAGITDATAVAAGSSHTCAVVGNGAVKCWGGNFFGQLGIGTMDNDGSSSPVDVLGITNAVAVATGDFHSCALLIDRSVKCWGAALANGAANSSGTPNFIVGIGDATALGTGDVHSCAMLAGGGVKCWGLGQAGQLGDGNNQASPTPLTVAGMTSGLSVAWTSSHPSARIDSHGRAIGVFSGAATISITAADAVATATLSVDNTPAGANVSVAPTDFATGTAPATLIFSTVTQPGNTSLTMSSFGPAPPAGFQLGTPPVYYELTTTAVFAGSITVCIDYTGIMFAGAPALYHLESGVMVDRTTFVDTLNEVVCGSVTSLSPFALFQEADADVPVIRDLRPDLRELWPVNHRMVAVNFTVDAHDNSGVAPSCRIVQVTSSEPAHGQGNGDASPDWVITADLSVKLRAERFGRGSGRVYEVTVRCADGAGNPATASASVHVPHDRRR
jgi:alpha-tubulin suppressor-like RCC1 family protein/sugar lactone lactonase YvrE